MFDRNEGAEPCCCECGEQCCRNDYEHLRCVTITIAIEWFEYELECRTDDLIITNTHRLTREY